MRSEPSDGLSNVGTNGQAWDIYVNTGTGVEEATAFRGSQAIAVGESFSVSFEHGGIADGGVVGVAAEREQWTRRPATMTRSADAVLLPGMDASSYSPLTAGLIPGRGSRSTGCGRRSRFGRRTRTTWS
ncbi:MAG: hypothetical protein R3B49_10815 [Phycisphaerales bacterium]